jgi:cytochrome c556
MKKTAIRGLKTAILSLALAGLIALPALAQEGAIKYRQSVMKAVGGHMAAMGAILKGTGGQARDLKVHANAMAALATVAANAFPEGSDFGMTRAKEVIWENPVEFKKVVQVFIDESAKLAKITTSGKFKAAAAQFLHLGKNACATCHKKFREKKK